MDLNPSEEQQQLIDAFAAFYAKESPDRPRPRRRTDRVTTLHCGRTSKTWVRS